MGKLKPVRPCLPNCHDKHRSEEMRRIVLILLTF